MELSGQARGVNYYEIREANRKRTLATVLTLRS